MKSTALALSRLSFALALFVAPVVGEEKIPLPHTEDLVAFWDFREVAGEPRAARNAPSLLLEERDGPIARAGEGPFGFSARIQPRQWFEIPRARIRALDIHGAEAAVTVVAWIKRDADKHWQAIAGLWDESRKQRQYCLFLNAAKQTDWRTMTRVPSENRFQGHLSSVGGPTPGEEFCITYASSGTTVPVGSWECLALTYDSESIRLYHNGELSEAEGMNPFPYPEGIHDGGENGAAFTVGSVSVRGEPGNFFGGWIGGLAVYAAALSPEQIREIATAASPEKR